MTEFNGTPHNSAKFGEIAKTVLMPGDPLRAKFVAETFFENPKQFNNVRGMLGYSGTYKGKAISVMGSGMGMPSMGIYSYELYNFYGVENIIRIGTTGALSDKLDLFDVLIVEGSYSQSTYAKCAYGYEEDVQKPSPELVEALEKTAKELGKKYAKGYISSSDVFYSHVEEEPCPYELLAAEMESFALFANAHFAGKKAACLLTVSDIIGDSSRITTTQERQTAFTDMMKIALETAVKL